MNDKGTVYLLGDIENEGVYKIGVTRGDIKVRIKKLQTGNSGEIYVVKLFVTRYPFFVESSLHRRFSSLCVLNEWYQLSKDDVNGFYDTCKDIENMAEALKDNPFFNYNNLKE